MCRHVHTFVSETRESRQPTAVRPPKDTTVRVLHEILGEIVDNGGFQIPLSRDFELDLFGARYGALAFSVRVSDSGPSRFFDGVVDLVYASAAPAPFGKLRGVVTSALYVTYVDHRVVS